MEESALWPLLIFMLFALLVVVGMLVLSHYLGQRRSSYAESDEYESGIDVTQSARLRFSPKFYLVAMFFVLFDIEAVFLTAWAIAFREVGWTGYIGAAVFIAILGIILIYEWRTGALDFGTSGKKIIKRMDKRRTKNI